MDMIILQNHVILLTDFLINCNTSRNLLESVEKICNAATWAYVFYILRVASAQRLLIPKQLFLRI